MAASTAFLLIACAFIVGFVLGRKRPSQALAPPTPPDTEALEKVRPILERDGQIAAIKAYREYTRIGLRDAKLGIDTLD